MFVGLDVHKETIDVSIAEGARHGEIRHYGVIASDLEPLDKVVRALRAPDRRLHFVYEAGPCGFGIYRHLTTRGEDCVVVSPSMIPKRSGDRVKTDRRDSQMLARLHRAGELRAIYIPDATDEAMRDLVRARRRCGGRRHASQTPPQGVPAPAGAVLSGARGLDAPVPPVVDRPQFPECRAAYRPPGISRRDC
jgi:transposase